MSKISKIRKIKEIIVEGGRKIMKAASFETALDDYGMESYGLMDEEVLDTPSIREDFVQDETDYDEKPVKGEAKDNRYDNNSELSLVNAYFKEVGCETLLKAKDEIEIAAKIKECELQAKHLINIIQKATDEPSNGVMEEYVDSLKRYLVIPPIKKGLAQKSTRVFKSM